MEGERPIAEPSLLIRRTNTLLPNRYMCIYALNGAHSTDAEAGKGDGLSSPDRCGAWARGHLKARTTGVRMGKPLDLRIATVPVRL